MFEHHIRDCRMSHRSRLFFISAISDFVGFGGRFFISTIAASVQVGGPFFISTFHIHIQTCDWAPLFISAYPHIDTPYPHIHTLPISAYPHTDTAFGISAVKELQNFFSELYKDFCNVLLYPVFSQFLKPMLKK